MKANAALPNDGELLARHAAGDGEAFAGIVGRHGPMVLAVCRRVVGGRPEAEDAAQAAFIALAAKARSLVGASDLGAWLHRAAHLASRQALRAELRRQTHEREAAAMRPSVSQDRAEAAREDWAPIRRRLDDAIEKLPAAQRRVLVACYFEGLSQAEAADALDMPIGTVAVYCRRGLKNLRTKIGAGRGQLMGAAGLAPLLLAHAGEGGALPGGFLASTVAAAKGAATGSFALALAKGVVKTMFWTKVKTVAALLGAVAILGVGLPVALAAVGGGEPARLETPAAKAGTRVTIDQQRRICVDGKPFFPIGVYSVHPEKLAHAKELGFNTVHTYEGEGHVNAKGINPTIPWSEKGECGGPVSAEDMRKYLDEAEKLDLKVFMGLPRYQIAGGMVDELQTRIEKLRTSPALLVWYLYDEPKGDLTGKVEAVRDLVHKVDPGHPTMAVFTWVYKKRQVFDKDPEKFRKSNAGWRLINIPDIVGTDHYALGPWFRNDEIPGQKLAGVAREILDARTIIADTKPVWNAVGLYCTGSAEQLRNQAYQSVAAGAKGVFYYAYRDSHGYHCNPKNKKAEWVKKLNAELTRLSPVLLSDEPKTPPVAVEKVDGILSKVFVHEGKAYVIVVNLKDAEPVTVTVTPAAGGKLPAEARVLFEDRAVKTADGKLSEQIEANGVRVYELQVAGQ